MLKLFATLIITLSIISLSGCAHLENLNFSRLFQPFGMNSKQAKIERASVDVSKLLENQEPVAAIEIFNREISDGLAMSDFPELYPKTINHLIDLANYYYIQGETLEAGKLYRIILINYPEEIQTGITSDMDTILINRNLCAEKLLDSGLTAYRKGNLQEAINVWTQIREFHPEYSASKRAIHTTKKQLKKLNSIKADSS